MIGDWNVQAVAAIHTETTAPPLAARNLAMLHVAIHDAVNSLTETHRPYAASVPVAGSGRTFVGDVADWREVFRVLGLHHGWFRPRRVPTEKS